MTRDLISIEVVVIVPVPFGPFEIRKPRHYLLSLIVIPLPLQIASKCFHMQVYKVVYTKLVIYKTLVVPLVQQVKSLLFCKFNEKFDKMFETSIVRLACLSES